MKGVRSLLLVCESFSCVVYRQRTVIYDFGKKLLKRFMKYVSLMWTVITERGILSEQKVFALQLRSP